MSMPTFNCNILWNRSKWCKFKEMLLIKYHYCSGLKPPGHLCSLVKYVIDENGWEESLNEKQRSGIEGDESMSGVNNTSNNALPDAFNDNHSYYWPFHTTLHITFQSIIFQKT